MIVRPETTADRDAISKVNDEAFGESIEAKLVEAIRASDRYVPERPLATYDPGFRGRAVYPPETFGIAY